VAWFALLTALLALVIAAAPTERGEIRAQGFILVDESGNEWGRLGWTTEGEVSYPVVRVGEERGWRALMTIAQDTGDMISAAGRAQGVAGRFGDGRVVVLGEAMIFMEFGLAYSGFDNRQLALNIVRWLSGELN
jgi:hypothetical protein